MTFSSLFGADPLPLFSIDNLQNEAPNIIVYAAPVMFFFVLLELAVSRWQNKSFYEKKETIGSTLVGIGNVLIGLVLKTFCD